MKKGLSLVLLLCTLLGCLMGHGVCAEEAYEKYSMTFFNTFDTVITIIGFSREEAVFQRVTQEAQGQFERLHKVFDAYNAYDGVKNLHFLNGQAATGTAEVEPELMNLLMYCKERQPLTQGTMNVALGAVLRLWHDFREQVELDPEHASLPELEALQAAAQHIDFDMVVLSPETNTVTFLDPEIRIDLGSVAKGYAAGLVGQWMLKSEMPSFILNAGGNVVAGDPPRDGRLRWGVSVQDPDGFTVDPTSDNMEILYLSNCAVVTSGDYQRYIMVDGVRYHHIILPDTLFPSHFMRAVTIVAEDSGWADILSTAVFLMPYEEGRAFVDALEGVEALWVLNDRTVEMTDGMRGMARSQGATSK